MRNVCITVYRQPEPALMLMDLSTSLKAVNGDVELAGDPEHAGCQYRPHNEVARNKSARYLFPLEEIVPPPNHRTGDVLGIVLVYLFLLCKGFLQLSIDVS